MPAAYNAIPSWQGDGFSDWREEQPAGRSRTIPLQPLLQTDRLSEIFISCDDISFEIIQYQSD